MKKLCILIFLIAALCPQAAHAQKQNPEPEQAQPQTRREFVLTLGIPADIYISNYSRDIESWDLMSGYESRFVKDVFYPMVGIQYQQFVSSRIELAGVASWAMSTDRLFDPIERSYGARQYLHNYYLLAQARYYYVNQSEWQFYSGVGLGGKLSTTFFNGKMQSIKPGLAYEAILFGYRNSVVIPFYTELVFGNTCFIGRIGIGFTF